jgi:hypothetical protein
VQVLLQICPHYSSICWRSLYRFVQTIPVVVLIQICPNYSSGSPYTDLSKLFQW